MLRFFDVSSLTRTVLRGALAVTAVALAVAFAAQAAAQSGQQPRPARVAADLGWDAVPVSAAATGSGI